jgi:flagella basal body P-ring formation protein FlgA
VTRTGLGALLIASLLPLPAWAAVVVRLSPEAVVRGEEIALGDVATVEGDEPLAGRLRHVRLGPAPAPGVSQRMDPDYLRLRLSEASLDPAHVRLVMPDELVVKRAFQTVPGAAVIEAATRHIQERLGPAGPGAEPYALVALTRPSDLRAPLGSLEIVTQLPGEPAGQSAVSATVAVKVDGRSFQSIPLSFRVGRYRTVAVATRALDPRTVLGPADWRIERRSSTEIPSTALAAIAGTADLEVVQPVRAGEPLTQGAVRPRIVVRRGELVPLLLEGPGFRITAQGLAVTDARRGDSLRVVNPTSKRETVGTVEASGVVRVPFMGSGSDR